MFPGRRLTRWCQLVPRVLMIAPGKLFIAKTTSTATGNSRNNNNESDKNNSSEKNHLLETTHCLSLMTRPNTSNNNTQQERYAVIIIAESESSSFGDVGFVFLKVPLALAIQLNLITPFSAAASASSSASSGPPPPKTRQEAIQRQRACEAAVENCLRYLIAHRTQLEKGTADSSCLIFEANGTGHASGDHTRQQIIDQVRARSGNTAASAILHVLYCTFSIIDYVCSNSKITEMIKSTVSNLAESEKQKRFTKPENRGANNSNNNNEPISASVLPPTMVISRQALLEKLNDAVTPGKSPQRKITSNNNSPKVRTQNVSSPARVAPKSDDSVGVISIEEIESEQTAQTSNKTLMRTPKRKIENGQGTDAGAGDPRARMVRLIKLVGDRRQRRIDDLEQMNRDYALLAQADATIDRSDRVVKQYLGRMNDIFTKGQTHEYFSADDDDDDNPEIGIDIDTDDDDFLQYDREREHMFGDDDETMSQGKKRNNIKIPTLTVASPEESFCRTQEMFLSLIVLKICNQKLSSRFATEMVEAERKLL